MNLETAPSINIFVQEADFDVQEVYQNLQNLRPSPGAIVTFTGLVRDFDHDQDILALELEHYPGMTEKSLHAIVDQAADRWSILGATVIHRVGRLNACDQIVLVAVSSSHRKDSFCACEFIMDYLKNEAPFWKKEIRPDGQSWVEAKQSDAEAKKRWQ